MEDLNKPIIPKTWLNRVAEKYAAELNRFESVLLLLIGAVFLLCGLAGDQWMPLSLPLFSLLAVVYFVMGNLWPDADIALTDKWLKNFVLTIRIYGMSCAVSSI